jgi:hypothetical protein
MLPLQQQQQQLPKQVWLGTLQLLCSLQGRVLWKLQQVHRQCLLPYLP